MKKINSTNYKAWLAKGNFDLEDALRLLENGGHADTICFHAQQAAEKYLKGYLVARHVNPRAIHHLEELAKDCAKFDKGFLELLDSCLALTRYYIETRYPPLVPIEYTKKEARTAIEMSEEIVKFVQARLS
jgi:HEPN domain-containing protein